MVIFHSYVKLPEGTFGGFLVGSPRSWVYKVMVHDDWMMRAWCPEDGKSSVSCELDAHLLNILEEKYGLFCVKRHQKNQQQKTYRIPGGMHHEIPWIPIDSPKIIFPNFKRWRLGCFLHLPNGAPRVERVPGTWDRPENAARHGTVALFASTFWGNHRSKWKLIAGKVIGNKNRFPSTRKSWDYD